MAQGIKREAYRKMNCQICGKEVLERKIGRLWYLPKKYCSEPCQALGHTKLKDRRPDRFCETCKEPLLPREFWRKDGGVHSVYTPKRFCSQRCAGIFASKIGRKTQLERTPPRGWAFDKHGYVILNNGEKGGYKQPEHRAVMEKMLGRKLEKHETVHHKNGIRSDNSPENLELWAGRHGRGQRVADLEEDIWSGMVPSYQINARL
jgi:hypothetical protein